MTNENIESLNDAIDIVNNTSYSLKDICDEIEEKSLDPYFPFPFGIWFRGQTDASYKLVPSVFRELVDGNYYDEEMVINHFKLRDPNAEKSSMRLSTFDLLCLMQHHNLPTRLLDWTESILIALYFAVNDEAKDEKNGKVFALNVRRLNSITRLNDPESRYVCASSSIDTIIRSELARSRRKKDLRFALNDDQQLSTIEKIAQDSAREWHKHPLYLLKKWLTEESIEGGYLENCFDLLRSPVAVFPNRFNPRMTSQQAMILIYGGKINPIHNTTDSRLPDFITEKGCFDLEAINGRNGNDSILNSINEPAVNSLPFLKSFIVPAEYKADIRNHLARIGMHEAALFPEIEHIGNFIKKQWTFKRNN